MGFTNKRETAAMQSVSSDDAELLARISFLGEKKSELEESLREREAMEFDVKDLVMERDAAVAELAVSRKEKALVDARVSEETEKVARLAVSRADAERHLLELAQKTEAERAASIEAERVSRGLEEKVARLAASARELDAALFGKLELVASTRLELEDLRAQVARLADEASARRVTLESEDRARHDKVVEHERRLAFLRASVAEAESLVEASVADGERIVAEASRKAAEIMADADSREAEITARDGDVSLRETFLVEKTDQLRKVKLDLEQYYNRTITHIKF